MYTDIEYGYVGGRVMKYGESLFDVLYLLFAIGSGILILRKADDDAKRYMGYACLVLGCGDALHLIPRVLNYFIDADFTKFLGVGKLITSITMTIFYVFMYYIWLEVYDEEDDKKLSMVIYILAAVRIILCLFPQNGWLENSSDIFWAILRNVPFVLLGGIIIWLYYRKRNEDPDLKWTWLLTLLSFAFYLPVAVGAGIIPTLGILMLPKTVCYIEMIWSFIKYSKR